MAVAARRFSSKTTQDVFDARESGESAVKLTLAEAALQSETVDFFLARGFDLESKDPTPDDDTGKRKRACEKSRSRSALLAKNLPATTTEAELRQLFPAATSIHVAPNHLIAVVEFGHPTDARAALKRNAYRRFKRSPLYLDWAPLQQQPKNKEETVAPPSLQKDDAESRTLYVTNVGFDASEADVLGLFPKALAASLPKSSGREKHRGFGFVDFASPEDAGRALRQGTVVLKGRVLSLTFAKQPPTDEEGASSSAANDDGSPLRKRGKHPAKLVVRNLAFATTARDLRGLFASFGQLKTVRLPKRFDGRHRGFGFVEFLAHRDAKAAKAALKAAHLYGRHLVIDYADSGDDAGLGTATTPPAGRDDDE